MAPELRTEIRQSRPFDSLEQEAQLSIERTAAQLDHQMAEAFKPYGITPTQYNVLRILRGAGEGGLCRAEVRDRMIAQVPDVTRLLDRMEAAGLIERQRGTLDRRYVTTRITAEGLNLLDEMRQPVLDLHQRLLGHLSREELQALIDILGKIRVPGC